MTAPDGGLVTFGYFTETDVRAHNTFLTILYKSGILGFLPMAWILASFLITGMWRARRKLDSHRGALLLAQVLCVFAILLTGMFSLVFESPFVGAPLWIVIGTGYSLMRMTPNLPSRDAATVPL